MVRLASVTSLLKPLFKQSPKHGNRTKTFSTPSRYLEWHIVDPDPWGGFGVRVCDEHHKVVAEVQNMDDAESIVSTHNKLVRDRAAWMGM